MLLSFIHRPRDHDAAVRAGKWSESGDFSFWLSPLTELSGLTMGIVGFGRIGRRVGEIAAAFGMKVVAYNPSPRDTPQLPDFRWCALEEVFETGDVISLHCPQTELNFGFVNRTLLKKMKPNAILINASRGGLINETDLADALNSEQIAGALLDVVSVEPIRDDNPLLQAKNCLLTPHMAWATVAARKRLMQVTADNIAAFLAGKPINVVN
jgi:glycerate dehydrogenase